MEMSSLTHIHALQIVKLKKESRSQAGMGKLTDEGIFWSNPGHTKGCSTGDDDEKGIVKNIHHYYINIYFS